MSNQKFSPKNYIVKNGRKFPIDECYIADAYDNMGLSICLIVRKQPGGKYIFANFVVDRHCLGVKDAFSNCNMEEKEIEQLVEKVAMNGTVEEVSPTYFHNLIYAAIDFAGENGFRPHKDFKLAEFVLDPELIDDGIDGIEVGEDGKPLFINGPFDEVDKVIATLNRNVGKGNYTCIIDEDDEEDYLNPDF